MPKKAGYKPRNPIRITLRTNAQEFIALEREDGDIPFAVRSAFDTYGQNSLINVPPRPPLLVGRDDDLLAVKKRIGFTEPKADLRTLTVIRGWPGVGKSHTFSGIGLRFSSSQTFSRWSAMGLTRTIAGYLIDS